MSEQTAALDPAVIYFTFSHIRPKYSCGRTIEETYQQILKGEINYETDLPMILVYVDKEGNYFSMNNRRLFLYKKLREAGELYTSPSNTNNNNKKNHKYNNDPENTIQVRLKPLPNTKRMKDKYSKEKCALKATLKREKGLHLSKEEEGEGSNSGSESDNNNDHSNNNSLLDDIHEANEEKEEVKQKRNKKNKAKNEMEKKDEDEKNSASNNNKNSNNNNISSTQQKKLKRLEKKKVKSNNINDTKTLEDELNDLLDENDSD